jgi:hypothetical protein
MLLKHMTPRAPVIFLLFSLRVAGGDVFPLGGGELDPAVGTGSPEAIGSNANVLVQREWWFAGIPRIEIRREER